MSQGVTYADLQFVRVPPENSPQPQPGGSGEGDLTYENIHAAKPKGERASNSSEKHNAGHLAPPLGRKEETPPGAAPCLTHGPKKPFWLVTLGLLGASLFLLATTIGFGVRYRQVSQHLQEALEASAAESRSLLGSLDVQAQRLLRTQRRLQEAEAQLNRSWTALQETEARLDDARQGRWAAEKALNATVAEACAGWCPEGWLLHGGKCLFFSTQKKTWRDSQQNCKRRAARLLVADSGAPTAILGLLQSNAYWTGQYKIRSKESRGWVLVWSDGSATNGPGTCVTSNPNTWKYGVYCDDQYPYICEKPARPDGPDPFLGGLA